MPIPTGGDLLLAAILLATPFGTPETRPLPADRWPILREAIQQLALDRELLDPRETSQLLAHPDNFDADINWLRRRARDLAGAPPVSDAYRFPDRETVNELIRFNRSFRKKIEERRQVEPDRDAVFRVVLQETDELYRFWDAVRDARCESYYLPVRRKALKRIRDALGDEDYANVVLPPNVPTWRFNELK